MLIKDLHFVMFLSGISTLHFVVDRVLKKTPTNQVFDHGDKKAEKVVCVHIAIILSRLSVMLL